MTMPVDPQVARRRWRTICLTAAVVCAVVLAASALPWFRQTSEYQPGLIDVDTINIWTEDGPAATRGGRGGLAQLAGTGQWAMIVMICAGIGALLALFARSHSATDPRVRTALHLNLACAALSIVFAVLAWTSVAGDSNASTTPHVGYLITLPALLGWLVLAVLMWRAPRTRPATA